MDNDEKWENFKQWLWAEWLQLDGNTPHAILTRRRLAEFEQYAEDDVAALQDAKDLLKTRADQVAQATLKLIAHFEETEEPYEMLMQFRSWLEKRAGGDANAHLTEWWISEFERIESNDSVEEVPSPTLH